MILMHDHQSSQNFQVKFLPVPYRFNIIFVSQLVFISECVMSLVFDPNLDFAHSNLPYNFTIFYSHRLGIDPSLFCQIFMCHLRCSANYSGRVANANLLHSLCIFCLKLMNILQVLNKVSVYSLEYTTNQSLTKINAFLMTGSS